MSDAYSTSDAMFHINWEHYLSPQLNFVQPTAPGLGSGVPMAGVMVRIGRGHVRPPVPSGIGSVLGAAAPAQLPLFERRADPATDAMEGAGDLSTGLGCPQSPYSLRAGRSAGRSPGGTRAAERRDLHVRRLQLGAKRGALRRAPIEHAEGLERLVQELGAHQLELELQNLDLQESQGALAASRNRYAELYDSAPVAYFTFDLSGRVLEANLPGAALVGRERGEIVGLPFNVLVRSLDTRAFFAHLRRCRDGEQRVVSDFRFCTPGGQVDVQAVSTPVPGPEGGVVGVRTTLTDISDRKAAEAERGRALELERQFRSRFEALGRPLPGDQLLQELARLSVPWLADCCMVVVPEAGRLVPRGIAHVDPDMEAKLHEGKCVFSVDLGESGVVAECWRTGRPVLETTCVGTGALPECGCLRSSAPRSVLVVPMVVEGQPAGFIVLSFTQSDRVHDPRDIPIAVAIARRGALALENARLLEEANRAIEARDRQLAAANGAVALRDGVLRVVAHDLRSPLAGVRMFGDALLQQVPEEERTPYHPVQMLRRTVDRMDHLIQDLVDAARIDGGPLPVHLGPVVAACVLTEAVEAHRELAARAGLELSIHVGAGVRSVLADRARLLQAFDNLITNAIKFSPGGGRIEIHATGGTDGEVVFSVRDTGTGVSAEQLPHIFDRFWQATPSDRRGAGLGLSIVKAIVDAHEGRIWVESEVGVGTTVRFGLTASAV